MKDMSKSFYTKEFRDKMIVVYLLLFEVHLVLNRIVPITNIIDASNGVVYSLFAGVGCLLILQDLFTDRIMFKTKLFPCLVAFLVALGISDFANISYGMTDNLKTWVWFCIQFFIIFTLISRLGKEKGEKVIKLFLSVLCAILTLAVIFSLLQYVFQIGYLGQIRPGELSRQGFLESRLFGVFSDPNHGAVYSVCIILFLVYVFFTTKKVYKKVISVSIAVLHFAYVILSGSRTAFITLGVAVAVIAILKTKNACCKKELGLLPSLLRIAVTTAVSVTVLVVVFTSFKSALSYVPNMKIHSEYFESKIESMLVKDDNINDNDGEEIDAEDVLKRDDVIESNILNNRSKIWFSYFECLEGSKIITGLSPRNAIAYIKDVYPDGYIAQTNYIAHSDYVAIIAYTGLLGVLAFLATLIVSVISIVKKIFSEKELDDMYIISLSVAVVLLIYGVAFMDIWFVNTLTGVLFWLALSYVMNSDRISK